MTVKVSQNRDENGKIVNPCKYKHYYFYDFGMQICAYVVVKGDITVTHEVDAVYHSWLSIDY